MRLALTNPEKFNPDTNAFARNLAALAVQLQWVEGDARRAEESFFNINQQAAPIDKTELKLLKDRRKPSSIAARAIIRSGKGHRYWSSFPQQTQDDIQELAKEINSILFNPPFTTPIKSLDLPIAGKVYSAQTLPMIFEMIGIVTNQREFGNDSTGETTIEVLTQVRRVARLLNSNHPSSLGLHPAVYFYSIEGRHKSASFLAFTDFIINLDKRKQLQKFTSVRAKFENFVIEHEYIVQQINRKYRTAQKSYTHISSFFDTVLEALFNGKSTIDEMTSDLQNKEFGYLSFQRPELLRQVSSKGKKFDTETKSTIYLRDVLKTAPKCAICEGYIHRNSISFDHVDRRREGGNADASNGQLTHPYCNTGYKN